jgi:ATPase subunit of ABC transporter with duplicated ATPase domains
LLDSEDPDLKIIEKITERLMEIDADDAEARASSILAGLGFTE